MRSYHNAAERFGDIRAYNALSRMYVNGLGTKVDTRQSKKWRELHVAAYRPANDVCISPEVLETLKLRWQEIENRNRALNFMVNAGMGSDSDLGRIIIGKIGVEMCAETSDIFFR